MRGTVPQLALGLAAAMLMTACGSTAQRTGAGAAGDGTLNQGLAAPQAGELGQASPGGAAGAPGAVAGGSGAGASTGGGQVGGSAAGTRPAAGGTGGSAVGGSTGATSFSGPGVTATTIALGIPYCNDCATGNASVGAGGENPGDTRRYYQTALDDVNARGGVLGRKLVPVFHSVSVSDNIDSSAQAACSTWTEDHKVLAMFLRGEIIYRCAAKAGVMVMGGDGSGPLFQRYPNMFAPATIRLERLGAVTVKAMVRAGWHKPEPKWPTGKIGLLTWENSEYKYAMENGYLAALHQAGLKETDVRYIAVPQSDKSLADASAAISSAVLAFRQAGIDHVFIADGAAGIFKGTGLTLLFLNNAKSQGYYPRYGFNTNNSPGWENLPADQEVGMLAIDSFDTEAKNDEGIAPNAQRERCFALMKKKSLPVGDTQTQGLAIGACEIAWFTEAVYSRVRSSALPDVIAAGESLGTSFRSVYTFGTKLSRGQHDGASLFRTSRFDEGCSCMKYTSKPFEP